MTRHGMARVSSPTEDTRYKYREYSVTKRYCNCMTSAKGMMAKPGRVVIIGDRISGSRPCLACLLYLSTVGESGKWMSWSPDY